MVLCYKWEFFGFRLIKQIEDVGVGDLKYGKGYIKLKEPFLGVFKFIDLSDGVPYQSILPPQVVTKLTITRAHGKY